MFKAAGMDREDASFPKPMFVKIFYVILPPHQVVSKKSIIPLRPKHWVNETLVGTTFH
jgi:hypothetical protein